MLHLIINTVFSCLILTCTFLKPLTEKVRLRYYGLLFALLLVAEFFQAKYNFSAFLIVGLGLLYVILITKNKQFNAALVLFSYFLTVVCNYLSLIILQQVFYIDVEKLTSSYVISICFYTYFLALVIVTTSLLKRYLRRHLRPSNFTLYQKTFILALTELSLAVIVVIFNIDFGKKFGYPKEIVIFNCFLFCLFFFASFVMLLNLMRTMKENLENERKTIEYNQLLEYIQDLEQTSAALRKFRHDYLNILLSLDLLIHVEDKDQLVEYFEKNIKPQGNKIRAIRADFAQLIHVANPAIKAIVAHKLQMARLQNITVMVEAFEDVNDFFMEPFDLSRILGLFLDNAIEASANIPNPYIHIAFILMDSYVQIIIENACASDSIPLERLAEEGFSTKGKNRGLGLSQVEEILSAYPNVEHYTQLTENTFTQTLDLFPKKEGGGIS